jgi:hypothetical protein
MKMMGRRAVLRGAGGIAMTLPVLEALLPRSARGGGPVVDPFAVFFRQADGVATAQATDVGEEPERFWPTELGALTAATMLPGERAVGELVDHASRLLVVGNINKDGFDYGCGHAFGMMTGLTAQGPFDPAAEEPEANGESLDHRIGRELNPDGRDSLFLYAGSTSGALGGGGCSYRGPGDRREFIHNPVQAYQLIMGLGGNQLDETLVARKKSINDFVRGEMNALIDSPKLSGDDRLRLEQHLDAIRDLEGALGCNLSADAEMELEGMSAGYDSEDGRLVLAATRLHIDVAALAIACGYTRSVAIQIGVSNNNTTRFENLDDGSLMENYHYISHRLLSNGDTGEIIPNSDVLHHHVDLHHARTFKHLLDRLVEYLTPGGQPLLDAGVAMWWNDLANGPGHSRFNCPVILAGSAGGYLKQGQYVKADGGDYDGNNSKLLNTIGTAVGLTNADGGPLDDFGDTSFVATGLLDALRA